MKNACKHFALCTLTLILCLALAACGSDNSGDSADYGNDSTVPSTIDGFVKESYDSYDYSAFEGYYLPDSGTDFDYLIIDTNGSRWRIGSNDDLAASGYLQYDADYDCIYAYNEHDGVAYQFSADGSSVNIYSLGSFTYEMSLDEFDAQAEDYNSSDSSVDLSYLAGIWYLDGDLDADSYIYIDSSGGLWGLYERAPGAETTEVDGGFATIDFIDRSLRGPGLAKLLEIGGAETIGGDLLLDVGDDLGELALAQFFGLGLECGDFFLQFGVGSHGCFVL